MALIASAAGGLLLLDTIRIWLPSLTTIYGSAGTSDPLVLAAFALAWVIPCAFAIPLARRWPTATPIAAAGVAVVARFVVQSGNAQLYGSCVAAFALFCWLVAIAVRGWPGRDVAIGFAVGLATTTLLQLLGGSVDLTWWPGPLPWLLLAAAGALMITGSLTVKPGPSQSAMWFAIGPALLLAGLITTTTTRADHAALVGVGSVTGIALAIRGGSAWPVALLVIAATALADLPRDNGNLPWWTVVPQATLAAVLPAALAHAAGTRSRRRPGFSCYLGLITFFVLCCVYFVVFDTTLPVWRPGLVLLAAVLVACCAIVSRTKVSHPVPWVPLIPAAAVMVFASVLTAPDAPRDERLAWPITLVTYNVRYGISEHGRFEPALLTSAITAMNPDVLLLQEVDRGMLVNGQHDVFTELARRLGMHAYYGPSSDPLFGDAILSRQPLEQVRFHALPSYDVATGAGVLSGVLRLPGGELGIAVSHLHENDQGISGRQVEDLATEMKRLRDNRPVLLAGDFNVEPDDPRLRPILADLRDGLAEARPLRTWPATNPRQQLDHVLVSEELGVSQVAAPRTTASDHLPVCATLTRHRDHEPQ